MKRRLSLILALVMALIQLSSLALAEPAAVGREITRAEFPFYWGAWTPRRP